MPWLIAVFVVAFLIWYALAGRKWLKTTGPGSRFLARIEPIEIALYKKSETLLIGRLTWLGGGIVTAYDLVAALAPSLDLTPVTARLLYFIPDDMRGVVVSAGIAGLGLVISWLRKRTSKPIEIVEAPTTPATIAAEIKVEAANAEAVATAEVATAEAARAA